MGRRLHRALFEEAVQVRPAVQNAATNPMVPRALTAGAPLRQGIGRTEKKKLCIGRDVPAVIFKHGHGDVPGAA